MKLGDEREREEEKGKKRRRQEEEGGGEEDKREGIQRKGRTRKKKSRRNLERRLHIGWLRCGMGFPAEFLNCTIRAWCPEIRVYRVS